jgi:hypothetical protein
MDIERSKMMGTIHHRITSKVYAAPLHALQIKVRDTVIRNTAVGMEPTTIAFCGKKYPEIPLNWGSPVALKKDLRTEFVALLAEIEELEQEQRIGMAAATNGLNMCKSLIDVCFILPQFLLDLCSVSHPTEEQLALCKISEARRSQYLHIHGPAMDAMKKRLLWGILNGG